jgi:xylulokinase
VMRPGSSFEELNNDALAVKSGSEGLLCIPLSSSTSGKGSFLNIDNIHTIKHFTRAVFEGVVFVNRIHFDLFRKAGL